jgi:hypothetical protein
MRRLVYVGALWLVAGPAVFAQDPLVYEQSDVPDALLTRPSGVNASGRIVGLYRDAQNAPHGFLRNPDGTYTTIDYPGAIFTQASTINARGDIAGRWTDAAGFNHGYVRTALGEFVRVDPLAPCVVTKEVTVVHGINDIGDLCGRCFNAAGKELGWLLRHGGSFQVFDYADFPTADAQMVTNRDTVVGDYSEASFLVHGFTWSKADGFAR